MYKTTLKIDGMMCGMCESHINDVVRKTVEVNKVTSSHAKGETVIISDFPVNEQLVTEAVATQGYKVTSFKSEPYEKKGLFSFLKKK